MPNNYYKFFFFSIILILYSCSLEQRIAVKYQAEIPNTSVILSLNPEVYKSNSKLLIPDNIPDDEYLKLYQESMDKSDIIGLLDAYTYWDQCKLEIEKNMEYSWNKYLPADSITTFIANDKPKFIFDFKQVEIEEHYHDFIDSFQSENETDAFFYANNLDYIDAVDFEAEINTVANQKQISSEDIENKSEYINLLQIIKPINSVTLSFWIEVNSYLENKGHKRELIFIQRTITEDIWNNQELNYEDLRYIMPNNKFEDLGYITDTLDITDLWIKSAKITTELTDILNSYIIDRVIDDKISTTSSNKYRKRHWKLNSQTGRVLPTDDSPDYYIIEQFDND